MPVVQSFNTDRSRARVLATLFLLAAFSLNRLGSAPVAAKEPSAPPAAWKTTQQDVATLVASCQFEQAIERLSDFIKSNPKFGPAYERRIWVTLDWLDLQDDIALVDTPLRYRAMPDPATGLGNIEPPVEVRRVFIEDWFHTKYSPPAQFKSVKQDLEACRPLMGKEFNDVSIEAFLAEFVGNLARAQELIGDRCKDGTATPRESLTYSRILRNRGDLEGALAAAGVAWKSAETRSQAASRAVNMLRGMKRGEDAKAFLDRWQKNSSSDPRMLFVRIGFATNPESIFKDFQELSTFLPEEAGFHYGLATREMQFHKNTDAAMAELNQAIELDKKSLFPHYARSCVWAKLNNAQSAADDATVAVERNPYFDLSYQLRAKAYRKLGDVESARADERYSLWLKELYDLHSKFRANPKDEDAGWTLAHQYSRREDWNPALRVLSVCLKSAPKHVPCLSERTRIYLALGKLDPALADATTVVRIAPEPASYSLRGDVYAKRQDWDKAVRDYDRAKLLDDRLEQALRQRAAWHTSAGRVEPAKADLARANQVSQADFSDR